MFIYYNDVRYGMGEYFDLNDLLGMSPGHEKEIVEQIVPPINKGLETGMKSDSIRAVLDGFEVQPGRESDLIMVGFILCGFTYDVRR